MATFEILTDNSALRGLIAEHLVSAGLVSLYQREFNQPLELANLVVVDVESRHFGYLKTIYENAGVPIIYTGHQTANPLYHHWLKRPFERRELLSVCRDAGIDIQSDSEAARPGWQCRKFEDSEPEQQQSREVHGLWSEVDFSDNRSEELDAISVEGEGRYLSGRTGVDYMSSALEEMIRVSKSGAGILNVAGPELSFTLNLREGIILSTEIEGQIGGSVLLEVLRKTGAISVYLYRRLQGVGELEAGLEKWLLENDEIDRATLRQMCQYRLMWCWDRLYDQKELVWHYSSCSIDPDETDWLRLPMESLGAIWERRHLIMESRRQRGISSLNAHNLETAKQTAET